MIVCAGCDTILLFESLRGVPGNEGLKGYELKDSFMGGEEADLVMLTASHEEIVYCQALADKIGVMISTLSAFCVPTAFPTSEICQA